MPSLPRASRRLWVGVGIAVALAALIATGVVAASGGGTEVEVAALPTPTAEPTAAPTPDPAPAPTPTPAPTPPPFGLAPLPTPTPRPVSPLNGRPISGPATRRVLGVKIDNHANARPQSGIERADMMIEIWVEGITRFVSVWQESDADFVGPIRSMRPTDFAMLNPLAATFVNSGGQTWIQAIGNASRVAWFQEPPGTFRIRSRYAPHNLYGDTAALRGLDGRGPYTKALPPLWNFGAMPAKAKKASRIFTSWPQGYGVAWTWNGKAYERSTQGAPHQYLTPDGRVRRITADTLVMLEMPIYTARGATGSGVPASQTLGSGKAWVFADGRVQRGAWERDNEADWFRLLAKDGSELTVPPGRLWVVLPQPGGVSFD